MNVKLKCKLTQGTTETTVGKSNNRLRHTITMFKRLLDGAWIGKVWRVIGQMELVEMGHVGGHCMSISLVLCDSNLKKRGNCRLIVVFCSTVDNAH